MYAVLQCSSASCFDRGVQVVEVKIKSTPGEPLGFHLAGGDAVSGRGGGEGQGGSCSLAGIACCHRRVCVSLKLSRAYRPVAPAYRLEIES